MTAQTHGNWIAGEWAVSAETVENRNPSDLDDVVGHYARADAAQTREAVAAARAAFPEWAAVLPERRQAILEFIGNELMARKDEIGALLSREEGKPLHEGKAEVYRAGQFFHYYGGECVRQMGEVADSVRPGVDVEVRREPLGVIGLITPWNFPVAIPAWKSAPALAYGNCMVLKPAELVPASAHALAEIISRSGMPAGVFNLVQGSGRVVGEALLSDPDVDAISFTGSVEVGGHIAKRCAETLKKVQLEMGGKNPLVVLDDADLETAAAAALNGAYFATGQRCTASSRLIVTEGIHDRFVEALSGKLADLRVGHALEEGTQMGPLVSEDQLQRSLDYIAVGQKEGANLHFGGQRLNRETKGYYLSPALFTGTTNAMRINREEIFGPVASVIKVGGYDEALATANDTPFGLTAGICTNSLSHARDFRRKAQAGVVVTNLPTAGTDYHVPFGGRKGSSYGPREQGTYAREFYTIVKTAYTKA